MLICGETNCSLYVGLSSFIFGCWPVNCPSNFIFSLTRCLVSDVIVFHMPVAVLWISLATLSVRSTLLTLLTLPLKRHRKIKQLFVIHTLKNQSYLATCARYAQQLLHSTAKKRGPRVVIEALSHKPVQDVTVTTWQSVDEEAHVRRDESFAEKNIQLRSVLVFFSS